MSHLGLSEAFGSFLLLALMAVAAFFLIRFLMRRFAPQPAGATTTARTPVQVAWPAPAAPAPAADAPALAPQPEPSATPTAAFVPAAFDSDGFARIAKTIFVRLQAANDAGDLDDLRRFTTPEMFAELKTDLLERAGASQATEVLAVDAQVLDVAEDAERQIVSVRFTGQVREAAGAEPAAFDEVWHLVKPHGDDPAWRIAGIEQMARA